MKKLFTLLLSMAFVAILFAQVANAQISVSGGSSLSATYTSFTKATGLFAAINATPQTGNNVIVSITGDVTDEDGATGLNSGAWTSITISPAGARTISGTVAGNPLVNFNGADNITINGLADGTNSLTISNLSISNTSGTSTIKFVNDATNNTITKCTILGSATMASGTNGGNIWFSTYNSTSATGNDNNTISYCNIGPAGTNLPTKGIYASGTTTAIANNNSGITITNNNIYDYFGAAVNSAGIYITTGNTAWTITNNKFYQQATRTFTTGSTHSGIYIANTTSADGFTITGNIIGYASSSGTGTYTIAGALSNTFYGIYLSGLSTSTTNAINTNTISNISFTTTNTGTTAGSYPFTGINISNGATTISVSSNTISNIDFPSTGTGSFAGIDLNSSGTGTHTVNENTITNFSRTSSGNLYGIKMSSPTTATFNHNTISFIALNNTTSNSNVYGIYGQSSCANITANDNSIYNLTTTSTGGPTICGIREGGAAGNKVFQNNKIYNLTAGNGTAGIFGIHVSTPSTPNSMDISGNEIYTFSGGISLYAIYQASSSIISNIYKNKIYDLSTTNTNPAVYGIYLSAGTTNNVYNNLISDLRTTAANAAIPLVGIYASSGTTDNIYYNTVYLNATSSGALFGSAAIYASTTPTVNFQNNIFVNTSTPNGATGYTAAYRRSGTTLTTYASTSNNNDFYAGAPDANHLIFYDGTNSEQTLAGYKSRVASRDAYSVSGDPGFTSTTDLTPDPANSNCWILSGNAMQISTITTDFAGASRPSLVSEGAPDIGAYEFTPTSTPTDLTGDKAPADGVTTTFTFFGKTIAKIKWYGTGITYPTLVQLHLKYYPGTNPTYGTNGNHYSNCYYTLTKDAGTISTYDITFYYQANQFFNIVASNLRLTKGDGSSTWTPYLTEGTGTEQYQIDAGNKTITVYGLSSFFHFSYTDSDAPLPVELSSFTSSVTGRNTNLKWVTASETNNAGFEILRSAQNDNGSWTKVGYVTGSGTKTTPTTYNFTDMKLNTGKYKYRLKQIDNNGNFEYYNLSAVVEVGVPTKYDISQNYPNPFNPTTKIDFDLPFDSKVSLKLYDMSGRELLTIVNEQKPAGYYTAQVNAGNLSSGAYFYRIIAEGNGQKYISTKKAVLIK